MGTQWGQASHKGSISTTEIGWVVEVARALTNYQPVVVRSTDFEKDTRRIFKHLTGATVNLTEGEAARLMDGSLLWMVDPRKEGW